MIDNNNNARTYIKIHKREMPRGSHGCIVIVNSAHWTTFKDLMNSGNKSGNPACVHNPDNPISIAISYNVPDPNNPNNTIDPIGNQPGPPATEEP